MEAAAIAAIKTIGPSIAAGINFKIAHDLSYQVVNGVNNIISIEISHPDVNTLINDLDIIASLKTIKSILIDLNKNSNKFGNTINLCISNLNDIVKEIETILNDINIIVFNHNKSWWAYVYKYPDISKEINNIKALKNKLNNRIELLTKIITIEMQTSILSQNINNNDE